MLKPEARIAKFEKMGFGMFVHWGLYSQLGKGEWILNLGKLDEKEYSKLKDTFTAENFNAEEMVLTAKRAGCKYITFTTRHHEGFSLYDTCGLSDYDAPHSPAKRDLVREFVDACNKKVKSIKWMDNNEELEFTQSENTLSVNLTGNPYGTSYCVRVAKAEVE